VGLPADPTPGDAFGIRALARTYGEITQIAGEASTDTVASSLVLRKG